MKPRIIGCGNEDRGDDAAGLLVARRLQALGRNAIEQSGEALALIESWSGAAHVILIDAAVTGAPVGTVSRWDSGLAPPSPPHHSTHGFGIAEAINLARVLGRLPQCLRIYGIEGKRFDAGAVPSAEVLAAVETVAAEIRSLTEC